MKYLEYVNVKQGTKSDFRYSNGNTLPLTQMPFGMLALAPQSDSGDAFCPDSGENKIIGGNRWWYDPEARFSEGVRITHQPSPWIGDYGALLITPQSDIISDTAVKSWSGIRPEESVLTPDYIKLNMLRSNATIEATVSERCMSVRVRFNTCLEKAISFFNIIGKMEIGIDDKKKCVYGKTDGYQSGKAENFGMYFVIFPKGEWIDFSKSKCVQGKKDVTFIANIPASWENEKDGEDYWRIFHMNDVNDLYMKASAVCDFPFISLYSQFLEYCDLKDITVDSLLADGLHPNDKGHLVIFRLILKELGIGRISGEIL